MCLPSTHDKIEQCCWHQNADALDESPAELCMQLALLILNTTSQPFATTCFPFNTLEHKTITPCVDLPGPSQFLIGQVGLEVYTCFLLLHTET